MRTYPNAGSHKFYKELYMFLQAVYKESVDETRILEMLDYFEKEPARLH